MFAGRSEPWYTSEATQRPLPASMQALVTALCQFQAANSIAPKDSKGNYGLYTSLAAVLSVANKAAEFGLCHTQTLRPFGDADAHVLITTLMHTSGEQMESTILLPSKSESRVNQMQALGSALTYARRYALLAIYGLASDDDDGQSAAPAPAKAAPVTIAAPVVVIAEEAVEFLDTERKARLVERLKASASKVQILDDFRSEFNITAATITPSHVLLPSHAEFIEARLVGVTS